jgi:outer membrane protein assembly factor BamB
LLIAGSLTGEVAAYELATRRLQWRRMPVNASVAFGLVADEEQVYVPYLSGLLVAIDVHSGVERWRLGGAGGAFSWTPLIAGDHVYVSGSEAGFLRFGRMGRQ